MDHFKILAPIYDRLIPVHPIHRWDGQLQLSSNMVMLDIGGGTGRIGSALAHSVCRIILADASLSMLKQSQENGKLIAVCTESENASFKNEIFDRIIMIDAFHHVRNQQETAIDLWRILKPGGRLLIIEPDHQKWNVRLLALFEKAMFMRSHFCSTDELCAMFSQWNSSISIYRAESNYCFVAEKTGNF